MSLLVKCQASRGWPYSGGNRLRRDRGQSGGTVARPVRSNARLAATLRRLGNGCCRRMKVRQGVDLCPRSPRARPILRTCQHVLASYLIGYAFWVFPAISCLALRSDVLAGLMKERRAPVRETPLRDGLLSQR
jgi:hypothetical protein